MTILVVDDEDDIRESLRELFEHEGFGVETASNGALALERMRAGDVPCVVILDLLMPVMGGREVFAAMQEDERLASVPVIVSTSDPSRAPSGVLLMKKPVSVDRLLVAVRQHCSPRATSPGA